MALHEQNLRQLASNTSEMNKIPNNFNEDLSSRNGLVQRVSEATSLEQDTGIMGYLHLQL
jgi:hypothetical protein